MDVKEVRVILADFDPVAYHRAALQKDIIDGVWPIDVEDAFLAAVRLFAPVGQRKYHIEEDQDKGVCTELVGRNDIMSRYIFMKTQKFRARKQVSSHIQVWVHCKKPPSNHNMDMETFQEIQTVFRLHYSRPTTGFGNQKKTRRVVSTSNVSKSVPSCDSLGIYKDSNAKDPGATRKHSMPASLSNPAKRFRRVVSELPPSSLGLLLAPSAIESPSLVNDIDSNAAPSSHGALVGCGKANPSFDPPYPDSEDMPLSQSSMFPSQEESIVQHPLNMVPQCGLSSETYGITNGADSSADSTAAAFMMATIAAMGGYEGLSGSGATANSMDQSICTDVLKASGFDTATQTNIIPLNSEQATPAPPLDMVSAFSAASGATCFPSELVYNLGHSYISTAESITAIAPTKQMAVPDIPTDCHANVLVEALSWYYSDNGFDSMMSMQTPQYVQEDSCMADASSNWCQDPPAFGRINKEMAHLDLAKALPPTEDASTGSSAARLAGSLGNNSPPHNLAAIAEARKQDSACPGGYANGLTVKQQTSKAMPRGSCGVTLKSAGNGSACTPSKRSSSKESDMTAVAYGSSSFNDHSSPILAAKDDNSNNFGGKPTCEPMGLDGAAAPVPGVEDALVVDWVSKLVHLHQAYGTTNQSSSGEVEEEVSPLPRNSANCDWYSMLENYLQGAG
ncbi:hypothetical protein EV175_002084 [Coemansia sp. RSA 1933]|nr:hypothetical protein EV175_002084 [Coemansia sp. RSA 1933]